MVLLEEPEHAPKIDSAKKVGKVYVEDVAATAMASSVCQDGVTWPEAMRKRIDYTMLLVNVIAATL
jgi:hypothetical protein